MVVDLAFEILDEHGNRLGLGGNEGDVVGAGEVTEVVGWAAFYTVADIEQAQRCRVLTLSSN